MNNAPYVSWSERLADHEKDAAAQRTYETVRRAEEQRWKKVWDVFSNEKQIAEKELESAQ